MEPGLELIRDILKNRKKSVLNKPGFTRSAVLFPLFLKDNRWHILLTKRTDLVKDHKGQISFPGGMVDKGDRELLHTALRETEEELGIRPEDIEILGELDDIFTLTRYIISPFVGVIPFPYDFKISRREISELIEVPISALLTGEVRVEREMEFMDEPYPVYYFYYGKHEIWGATARIIKQLLSLIFNWQEP